MNLLVLMKVRLKLKEEGEIQTKHSEMHTISHEKGKNEVSFENLIIFKSKLDKKTDNLARSVED